MRNISKIFIGIRTSKIYNLIDLIRLLNPYKFLFSALLIENFSSTVGDQKRTCIHFEVEGLDSEAIRGKILEIAFDVGLSELFIKIFPFDDFSILTAGIEEV